LKDIRNGDPSLYDVINNHTRENTDTTLVFLPNKTGLKVLAAKHSELSELGLVDEVNNAIIQTGDTDFAPVVVHTLVYPDGKQSTYLSAVLMIRKEIPMSSPPPNVAVLYDPRCEAVDGGAPAREQRKLFCKNQRKILSRVGCSKGERKHYKRIFTKYIEDGTPFNCYVNGDREGVYINSQ
jgi:hypothetical protein